MILKAVNVTKEFSRSAESKKIFSAVSETNLTLEQGKLSAITGKSGSGKSTLLNIFCGLLKPTAGDIFLDDVKIYDLDDDELSRLRNKNFGVVPQVQSALKSLSVLENILLPCKLYNLPADLDSVKNLMSVAGIENLADSLPNELSGGELRRMAVVRALILKPAFVFADEPTNDLDEENTEIILKLLRKTADDGAGVLIVSHEVEVKNFADFVFEMKSGILSKNNL